MYLPNYDPFDIGRFDPLRSIRGVWFGFRKTDGLEQYRARERYRVWVSQHENLVDADARYAVANARFQVQLVSVWVFALIMFFNYTFATSGSVAIIFSTMGAFALGWLVMRDEQDRRNKAIGEALSRQPIQ